MTILEHPDWLVLLPYLYIRRGGLGVNGARHRIEVRRDAPARLLDIRTACAYCGAAIQNIRIDARGAWTFNASCPLSVNVKCARMPPTTAICAKVRKAILHQPAKVGLFE
ncbi:MAG TPA: hypothetical protein VKB41_08540 [Steroidobacteraceae bacterium]|nr:hypothetical protein [Steroidobacteraceae bacterium]